MHILNDVMNYIVQNNLLNENGIIVCEIDNEYLDDINSLKLIKSKKYGSTYVYIYKNNYI